MTYIRHVTLATCHARDSYRSEVDDAVIEPLQELIAAFAAGKVSEPQPIPAMTGYSISGRVGGRCMVASVWADGPPSELLLSIGVAEHERCGAAIWRTLHQVGAAGGQPHASARAAGGGRIPDYRPRSPASATMVCCGHGAADCQSPRRDALAGRFRALPGLGVHRSHQVAEI